MTQIVFNTLPKRSFWSVLVLLFASTPASTAWADPPCEDIVSVVYPKKRGTLGLDEHILIHEEGCRSRREITLEKDSGEVFLLERDGETPVSIPRTTRLTSEEPLPEGNYVLNIVSSGRTLVRNFELTIGDAPELEPQTPTLAIEDIELFLNEEDNTLLYIGTLNITADHASTVKVDAFTTHDGEVFRQATWTPNSLGGDRTNIQANFSLEQDNEPAPELCIQARAYNVALTPSEPSNEVCVSLEPTLPEEEEEPVEEEDGENDPEADNEGNGEEEDNGKGDEGQGEGADGNNAGCSTSVGSSTGSLGGPLLLLMLFVGLGRRRRDPRG